MGKGRRTKRTRRRTKQKGNKGALKWGSKLDAESDYRILADELTQLRNNDVRSFERVYLRFKKEWLNIIKKGYSDKFYGRLTGKKSQLWKSIHIFYMNKPPSKQRYSKTRKKARSLLTRMRSKTKNKTRTRLGTKQKTRPSRTSKALLDKLDKLDKLEGFFMKAKTKSRP